jgi:hypothetical protein
MSYESFVIFSKDFFAELIEKMDDKKIFPYSPGDQAECVSLDGEKGFVVTGFRINKGFIDYYLLRTFRSYGLRLKTRSTEKIFIKDSVFQSLDGIKFNGALVKCKKEAFDVVFFDKKRSLNFKVLEVISFLNKKDSTKITSIATKNLFLL